MYSQKETSKFALSKKLCGFKVCRRFIKIGKFGQARHLGLAEVAEEAVHEGPVAAVPGVQAGWKKLNKMRGFFLFFFSKAMALGRKTKK